MYQNNNLYDKLRTAVVGKTWPAEYYDWIDNGQIKHTMQKIAIETNEDLQLLSNLLESLGVEVIRPEIKFNKNIIKTSIENNIAVPVPPMSSGDYMVMAGNKFIESVSSNCNDIIKQIYQPIFDRISQQGNEVISVENPALCAAMCYQFKDRFFYSKWPWQTYNEVENDWKKFIKDKKIIGAYMGDCHLDGWFCPVRGDLIVSANDVNRPKLLNKFYSTFFKNAEVIYRGPSLLEHMSFKKWQQSTAKNWWIPGEELNHEFCNFADRYFTNWFGDVAETVFEVNMVVVDDRTVIIKETNNNIVDILKSKGITVYQTPFRYSSFWDAGINCVTLALNRY